jgi:hypothetical protein
MIGRPGCQTAAGGARATLDSGHQEPRYFTHGAAIAAECARREGGIRRRSTCPPARLDLRHTCPADFDVGGVARVR